jgi:A/G-specific adenine glycosylase
LNYKHFAHALLQWYPINKRELPWRNTQNPYIIWLSEIILQQTRVAQGLPYFIKFSEKYPTVIELANAPQEDVLRMWQGLGYYSRARNLHACAKQIATEPGGQFPDNYADLLKLKGVGTYTAAAIASFAYKEKVAVVDGNVFRVLSRYFGLSEDIGTPLGKKTFENLANRIIPTDQPDQFNQAIMEFGALQCTPKSPDCVTCPLKESCYARRHQMINLLPVKEKKVKVRSRNFVYYHIICGDHLMVKKRGGKDIWEGLHDFPMEEVDDLQSYNIDQSKYLDDFKNLQAEISCNPEINYKHILTHQRIFSTFVVINVGTEYHHQLEQWASGQGWMMVSRDMFEELGKPKLIVNYLNAKKY